MRRHGRTRRRSDREYDDSYMPCVVRSLAPSGVNVPTKCCGEVQADHMGARPLGRKADDRTCVPMCRKHHVERTDHSGMFFALTRDELREWRAAAIEQTQREVAELEGAS